MKLKKKVAKISKTTKHSTTLKVDGVAQYQLAPGTPDYLVENVLKDTV